MDKSDNLELPYIMPNQAQKHVTHNEAIRYLDALVQISVESRTLTSPPTQPVDGSRYIIAGNAQGEWENKSNQLASFQDGAWAYFQPKTGWLAWLKQDNVILVYNNNQWEPVSSDASAVEQFNQLGINTSANEQSRFGVSSENSFFTHEGSNHRLSINKSKHDDTGSLIFQTDWAGRAEMGLAGSDDFSIKVTSNGVNWHDGIVVSADSGKVSFPSGLNEVQLSGTPENLNGTDIIYIDAISGDDFNDGTSVSQSIKTLERLEELFSIGRRFQICLLSDLVWDFAISISYPIAMLNILGRRADNGAYEKRTITIKDSKNVSNLPGCLFMNCISKIYIRSVNINLDTSKGFSFLNYSNTMGYLRTLDVSVTRTGSGTCSFYADGSSFVASKHQSFTIDNSAKGYIAKGVGSGENPNSDWRYASNITSF